MTYSQKLSSYQTANETVQKTRQVVMLYDAVIRFLKQAKTAIEEKNFEERMNLIQKANNIIVGLNSSIDFEKGGDISTMLHNFYSAIELRMMSLNTSNNIAACEQIIREIKMMRDAWDKIDQEVADTEIEIKMPDATSTKSNADFSA